MAAQAARQVATSARRQTVPVSDPILASKITAPEVPGWALPRARITKLIAEGARWCPLTAVTGPLGAGKTMAVALWAAADQGPVAWVSLDEYDNRPAVFWSYVVAALRRSSMALPKALSAGARGRAADHVFLLQLASALAAQDPPVTLVLDDFHLITEPKVLKGLDFVLRNTGPGMRLVVGSRMDPLLPLHRYRLAGELAEIRASDLAFTAAETGLLLAQHRCALPADSLEGLTRRTEGWAACIRLAAMSMDGHPDPGQFVKELIAEDSALTGYLVEEVLNTQTPEVREALLGTSILDQVNVEAASELLGDEQAGRTLLALAQVNAFVQPVGGGWYRYHPLLAEVLRLKLLCEYPGQVAVLHQRAAHWYQRNGLLAGAVRHAAQAGDWQLAASMVVDELALSEIIEPRGDRPLAGEFQHMPDHDGWTEPQPYLVRAAVALSDGRPESAVAALDAADDAMESLPVGQEAAGRLAAAMMRLTAAPRAGDFAAAAAAATRAEALLGEIPEAKLARRPEIRAHVLSSRGAAELWAGHLDEAARLLDAGVTAAAATAGEDTRAGCLGMLALVEALRGRLHRAADLAGQAAGPAATGQHQPAVQHLNAAAHVALAWVHLQHDELREARGRLRTAEAALGAAPDKLIAALAQLIAACDALADGRADEAAQIAAGARSGWPVPAWLGDKLSLAEARAHLAADDTEAARAAAERAGEQDSAEAAVTLAHAWVAAGEGRNARRALAPVLAAQDRVPGPVRVQAWLVDAQLSYHGGDQARGHRSLKAALRLAEPEQLRLPFALERSWIGPVLRRDPELAQAYQHLLPPALRREQLPAARHDQLSAERQQQVPAQRRDQLPARLTVPGQPSVLVVEPLTEREREVLQHASGMLNTAEIASAMFISINTVKAHLKSIYRKLAAGHRGEAVRRARQLQLI